MVAQSIVYQFCASGALDRSIATVKAALAERVELLVAALERELPEARFEAPEGGYFMWVELPEGTDVAAVFDEAKPSAASRSSRAPTSCSRAARTRCASPTPASPPTRSTRASPPRRGGPGPAEAERGLALSSSEPRPQAQRRSGEPGGAGASHGRLHHGASRSSVGLGSGRGRSTSDALTQRRSSLARRSSGAGSTSVRRGRAARVTRAARACSVHADADGSAARRSR